MKLIIILVAFTHASIAFSQQLAPNDTKLKIDPRTNHGSVDLYVVQSGLDKLAKRLNTDPQHMAPIIDQAVDNLVVTALDAMNQQGYTYQAGVFEQQYNSQFKNYVQKHFNAHNLFDHKPYSDWLVSFYAALVSTLGEQFCIYMHFDDINEINYALTVVLTPTDPQWDIVEYRKHFVPMVEGIAYWFSWIACEAITFGSTVTLLCNPIGTLIEDIATCCVSPQISDAVYKRANNLP